MNESTPDPAVIAAIDLLGAGEVLADGNKHFQAVRYGRHAEQRDDEERDE